MQLSRSILLTRANQMKDYFIVVEEAIFLNVMSLKFLFQHQSFQILKILWRQDLQAIAALW